MSQQTPTDPDSMSRRQQFAATYRMAKQSDTRLWLWLLGTFVVGAAAGFGLFWFLPGDGVIGLVIAIVGALLLGTLLTLIVFGRRAQKAAYQQMDGQVGAAANALKMLRRGWKVDPLIAFTKQQDVVHRVVGPPGIVLVGEGNPHRLRTLLANERRKHERVAADTPIHEVVVGSGEGQVPLPKLVRHVQKLGRAVKPADLTDVLNRLKALDATRSTMPIPKGPVPTSMKGLRGQMRGR
ncbi:DUF4191 domain-containing protein [Nocardioides taihuensis]|uniref:DUF4191 domain-containing protein n=1 Tax=Nocardioides taihuensis TaxID=1835606 RepID=A0ABW0BQN5_9ACTN